MFKIIKEIFKIINNIFRALLDLSEAGRLRSEHIKKAAEFDTHQNKLDLEKPFDLANARLALDKKIADLNLEKFVRSSPRPSVLSEIKTATISKRDILNVEGKERDHNLDVQEIIKNQKINNVVHFTRLQNLEGILSCGLLTRKNILNSDIFSEFNDKYRFDQQKDSISCSIEFPNYKMFYKLQRENPDREWIVILLDPSLLWEKICAFSATNAANKSITSIPIEQRKGADALQKLFDNLSEIPNRNKIGLPVNYPTDPQAEVLVFDNIEQQYITGIVTQSEKIAIELESKYPDFEFLHNESIFRPRIDYRYWRSN